MINRVYAVISVVQVFGCFFGKGVRSGAKFKCDMWWQVSGVGIKAIFGYVMASPSDATKVEKFTNV